MTTVINSRQTETTIYEPTIQDRIQRVLYRLDCGESLIDGSLQRQGSFCVLGIFADEYPGRTWVNDEHDVVDPIDGKLIYKCVDDIYESDSFVLTEHIAAYYGFHDIKGSFKLDDISDTYLRNRLAAILPNTKIISLDKLNDLLIFGLSSDYNWDANSILAGVIRSGAPFVK